jgi:nucleoside-diphosphate-sugar epimerase
MYPDDAISSNIYGTYNLLEYSGKFGVKKFIFASSAAVYGIPKETPIREDTSLFPINLYGVTKLAGENLVKIYCEEYGLDGVCLRFGNVYGLGIYTHWKTVIPKFVRLALLGRPLTIYGDGNQTRDFIHVRDINSAIKLFIDLDRNFNGDVYNISTGKAISINRVADIVSDVVREMFDKDVERIYLPPREGEPNIENFCLSNNKVCGLGFRPSSSIREGIIEIIDFYNSFGGVSLDE